MALIQSSRDLRYLLLSGPVSLRPFRILKMQETRWSGYLIHFYVLAVSHAVTLENENHQLTEFLSCMPVNTSAKVITQTTASGLPWKVDTRVSMIDYSCSLTLGDSSRGDDFRNPFDPGSRIAAQYPISPGFATPITRIGWRVEPSQIFVETIHSYPEEDRVVRSESLFTFR
jgi:hypothetical protein